MTLEMIDTLSITSFKLGSLFVGLAFAYMGYQLFVRGIWGNAGHMEGTFQDTKLVIKNAAPGTFFSVLGAIILCFTIFKGFQISSSYSPGGSSAAPIPSLDIHAKPAFPTQESLPKPSFPEISDAGE